MDDVQAKAMAQVILEEDKRGEDDDYYRPNRKVNVSKHADYKPYSRNGREESRVDNVQGRTDWRKDPNLPPTYYNLWFRYQSVDVSKRAKQIGGYCEVASKDK